VCSELIHVKKDYTRGLLKFRRLLGDCKKYFGGGGEKKRFLDQNIDFLTGIGQENHIPSPAIRQYLIPAGIFCLNLR
jgi:hypothetical protein